MRVLLFIAAGLANEDRESRSGKHKLLRYQFTATLDHARNYETVKEISCAE